MRNLTVRRNKTFVGCAAKIQIYIEDMNSTETIGGIPCRLLGVLKNGESATFPIEDSACKIIASFRGPGKNQFYDYYKLPEGTEDWYLSGKCQFNPGAGNAFLFDNGRVSLMQDKTELFSCTYAEFSRRPAAVFRLMMNYITGKR